MDRDSRSAKTLTNPLDPVRIRCHCCESKWFYHADDFKQHMKARHPELTVVLVCDGKYLLCPSTKDSADHPLTYHRDATKIITTAARACIRMLATIGLKITAWTAMGEIEGRDPIVVTDKGGVKKLPAVLNLIPSVHMRHKMARDLAEAEAEERNRDA
jgi:hypothetical protein